MKPDPMGRWAPYIRWAATVALLIFVVPRLGPGVTLPPLPTDGFVLGVCKCGK